MDENEKNEKNEQIRNQIASCREEKARLEKEIAELEKLLKKQMDHKNDFEKEWDRVCYHKNQERLKMKDLEALSKSVKMVSGYLKKMDDCIDGDYSQKGTKHINSILDKMEDSIRNNKQKLKKLKEKLTECNNTICSLEAQLS